MKESFITTKPKLARHLLVFAWALAGMTVGAYAQQSAPSQPSETTPKVPSFRMQPGTLLERLPAKQPETPAAGPLITPRLKGVIIVKTKEEILASGVPRVQGVEVRDIPFLNGNDFPDVIATYLEKPLDIQAVKNLQRDIIVYCRSNNRPLVDVILPEQTVENGVIQLWLLEGKVGTVSVQTVGKKWFKDQLILDQVRLRAGEPVDSRRLMDDLDWINRNPFHQVDAQFKQGAQVAQSDVVLLSQERFPVRLYAGYEDSGTKLTGEDRVLAGFNWGNAFGLDHQLNYQYMTDTDFEFVKAHSGSYSIPLPWRHNLTFFGSYVDAKADLGSKFSSFGQQGFSYQLSVRYGIPLPSYNQYRHELSFGFDYKVSNNSLLFDGTTFAKPVPEVDQFEFGYSGVLPDRYGQTSFGLEAYYSYGDLTDNNTDNAFKLLRPAAHAHYEYVRWNAERDTRLLRDFSWILKLSGQLTSGRLLPSEELGAGGYNTVRGYDERVADGDEGWIISNELRTPPISLLRFSLAHLEAQPKHVENSAATQTGGDAAARPYPDQLQFLAFLDYATTHITYRQPGEDSNVNLASVGAGMRYVINRYFSVRFDYGWQLIPSAIKTGGSDDSRGHVAVLLSY